jgi:hypothetical protein
MNLRDDYWMNVVAAIVLVILGAVIIVGVQSKPGTQQQNTSTFLNPMGRAEDRAAQSDLRNALTVEKTEYTDTQVYTADVATLKGIEASLDWGGKLQVTVGRALVDGDTVCLSEMSQSGTMFSLADIAAGSYAGTYYGETACPPGVPASALSRWPSAWGESTTTIIGGGTLSNSDDRDKCVTEGDTFDTALNAYYAQHESWPAGYTTVDVAAALVNAQFLQPGTLHYLGRWTYNSATHSVDTSGC